MTETKYPYLLLSATTRTKLDVIHVAAAEFAVLRALNLKNMRIPASMLVPHLSAHVARP